MIVTQDLSFERELTSLTELHRELSTKINALTSRLMVSSEQAVDTATDDQLEYLRRIIVSEQELRKTASVTEQELRDEDMKRDVYTNTRKRCDVR